MLPQSSILCFQLYNTNSSTQININFILHKGFISILCLVSLRVLIMQSFLHSFLFFFGRTLLFIFSLIYTCNSSFLLQVYSQQHAIITSSFTWFIIMQNHQSHKQNQSINMVWISVSVRNMSLKA